MNLEIGHTIFGFISWFVWYLRNTTLIFIDVLLDILPSSDR